MLYMVEKSAAADARQCLGVSVVVLEPSSGRGACAAKVCGHSYGQLSLLATNEPIPEDFVQLAIAREKRYLR